MSSQIATKERINKLRELRIAEREAGFSEALPIIGREAVGELRELYSEYDERFLIFAAELYDPELGAFYYSKSARDTDLFLPDVESTMQIYYALERKGDVEDIGYSYAKFLPEKIRMRTVDFVTSLQDEDGFFYHPQWGKGITLSRRARDLAWSRQLLAANGVKPKYLLPTDKERRIMGGELSPHLSSLAAFRNYLSSLEISKNSLAVGNLIDPQISQIRAAGDEFCRETLFWLAEHQRQDSGLWEDELTFSSVNGCSRLALCHKGLGGYCPNAQKVLESMVKGIMLDEDAPYIFAATAPWSGIAALIQSMSEYLGQRKARESRAMITENATEMIARTRRRLSDFRKPDGSCSYFANSKMRTTEFSQGVLVSVPMCDEGDANSSGIRYLKRICGALGIPSIPVYTLADIEFFIELLENAPKIEKKQKYPYGENLPLPIK